MISRESRREINRGRGEEKRAESMASFFSVNCILHTAEVSRETISKGLVWNLSFHFSLLLPLSLPHSCLSALCLYSSFYFFPFWMSFLCRVMIAKNGEDKKAHGAVINKTAEASSAYSIFKADMVTSCTSLLKKQEISRRNSFISYFQQRAKTIKSLSSE